MDSSAAVVDKASLLLPGQLVGNKKISSYARGEAVCTFTLEPGAWDLTIVAQALSTADCHVGLLAVAMAGAQCQKLDIVPGSPFGGPMTQSVRILGDAQSEWSILCISPTSNGVLVWASVNRIASIGSCR